MIDDFLYSLNYSFLSSIGLKSDNFLLVKHYNSFYFSSADIKTLEENSENIIIYFHELDPSNIIGPFEPFLNIISDYCNAEPRDLDEIFDSCNIYSLHRSIFSSYIKTGVAKRMEEVLLDEIPFEKDKLLDSFVNLLLYITQKKPILFVINELQSAGPSTLNLLNKIIEQANNNSIAVLATYNESQHPLPRSTSAWSKFYSYMVDGHHLIESGVMISPSFYERITDYNFNVQDIPSYLKTINNLCMFLDFEHAIYYLEIIYKIINVEGVSIPEKQQFEFLENYIYCAIYTRDMSKALLLASNMKNLTLFQTEPLVARTYYVLSTYTYMYNGRMDVAKNYAKKALRISKNLKDDYLIYQVNMLQAMIKMNGWHNIFFCSTDIPINPDLIRAAEKYQQHNHLAHVYTYAFDNDPESFSDESQVEQKLFNVNKGIAYAKMLKNDHFLFAAYRNNIMIASTSGYYKTANYFYHKSFVLVKGKDIFSEATIYNGLGYNSTATEDFSKANEYYNKALRIFYDLDQADYIGETFYNMALNCIMAHDYENAYEYLSMALKIVEQLRLNSLRVCNISKLFGLLALSSYRLDKTYSCNLYINNTRQFLSHLFTQNIDSQNQVPDDYATSSDDLFIYYYVIGLISAGRGDLNAALSSYEKAELMLQNSLSNQFYTYSSFSIEYAGILEKFGQTEKAKKILTDASAYFDKQGCYNKVSAINAVLDRTTFIFPEYHLKMESLTKKQVLLSLKHVAIVKENREHKARLEFLSTWQKTIDLTGKSKEELIYTAVHTFINNFNLDRLLYIEYDGEDSDVLFNNTDISLSQGMHGALKDYFKKKRLGFVTSKINTNYNDYLDIITLFGDQKICSIVGIPFYKNESLCGLLIVYILMKDNWQSHSNYFMLDESDFKIYDFVFRQLLTALETYDANEKINKMNTKLKHLSVTDHLTGLLNREGFYANIKQLLDSETKRATPISILYIDLDNFKFYNDSFGHHIGDLILTNMSEVFESACGNKGFVSRYGGDEFIILLRTDDKEVVTSTVENIYKQFVIKNYFTKEIESVLKDKVSVGSDNKITCSIGIAISSKISTERGFNALLKKADTVLYDIKKSEKGTFAFSK